MEFLIIGQPRHARDPAEKSLFIKRSLAKSDPKSLELQHRLMVGYHVMGDVLLHLDEAKSALPNYRKAFKIARHFLERNANEKVETDLSLSYNKLGDALLALGDTDAAFEQYEMSFGLMRDLVEDRGDDAVRHALAISATKMGNALSEK